MKALDYLNIFVFWDRQRLDFMLLYIKTKKQEVD